MAQTSEIHSPLNVVRSLFEHCSPGNSFAEIHARVSDHFDRVFHSDSEIRKIPSLNTTPAHRLPPNSLVRFRCMIQDQQDPEFYVAAAETTNSQTGEKRWTCSMYTDEVPEEFSRDMHASLPSQRFSEKHRFHCVSVPGESPWVTKLFRDGPDATMDDVTELTSRMLLGDSSCPGVTVNSKYIASKYPFPEEHTAVLVKMYKKDESLKVTEQIEFIGVLGAPVETNDLHDEDMTQGNLPCLHAITFRRMGTCNNNPYLLEKCRDEAVTAIMQNTIRQSIQTTREQLLTGMADAFGDDRLAAEFLLLQLFSRIHLRKSDTILGNLSLNIVNSPAGLGLPDANSDIPKDSKSSDVAQNPTSLRLHGFAKDIFNVLQLLLPKAHSIPLSLDTLNRSCFYPKSNGDLLESGILQVPEGSWFAVDETVLEEGALNDQGVRNMQALKHVLTNQTLQYAFPYTTVEMKTDIGFLILSGKKSLLPVDCVVPLSDECSKEAGRRCSNGHMSRLASEDENTLDRYREYIGVFRQSECNIPERMATYIQNDFVQQRRDAFEKGTEPMTDTDLAFLLNLARVVSLSFGSSEMTEEMWSYARRLDEARKERLRTFGKATPTVDVDMTLSTDDDRVAR